MKNIENKIKYFLYARKSSESEDRQVASIESQISELTKIAKNEGLKIVEVLSESQSAKAPGRPLFNKMIERIYNGEAQGIICWKLDRLARNPVDGGNISWMLQRGAIQHIQTHERDFCPTDNVLVMSVEFGMANQYILDLSQNTKRGLRTKAEKGWYPGPAPTGYLNSPYKNRGEREIIKDPKRFNLVKKMFSLMLTGSYNPLRILGIANKQWGFRTLNGKQIARSTIYRIFTNPFYHGNFEYPVGSNNWYQGKHEPMITESEYSRIQFLLGRKEKSKPKTHTFAFTGMIRCEECGAMVTAEEKIKRQKNGNTHQYVYYHCTKRKNPDCSQKCIEQKELEKQITKILERIEIPHSFYRWAIKQLEKENKEELKDRNLIIGNQRSAYDNCVKRIDKLIELRMDNEITQDEFLKKKSELLKEKERLNNLINDTDGRVTKSIEMAGAVFSFARDARRKFQAGTIEDKKQILLALGSNLFLKDKILTISIKKPLLLVEKVANEVNTINHRLEPLKKGQNERKMELLYSRSPRLLRGLDSNQDQILQGDLSYH